MLKDKAVGFCNTTYKGLTSLRIETNTDGYEVKTTFSINSENARKKQSISLRENDLIYLIKEMICKFGINYEVFIPGEDLRKIKENEIQVAHLLRFGVF